MAQHFVGTRRCSRITNQYNSQTKLQAAK